MRIKLLAVAVLITAVLGLSGCEGLPDGDVFEGEGYLVVNIADRAVNDVDEINLTIDEVQANRIGGSWEVINDFSDEGGEKEVDLLDLRFEEVLLGRKTLPAGEYINIRLVVDAAEKSEEAEENTENEEGDNPDSEGKSRVVYEDGDEEEIFIPADREEGVEISYNFTLRDNKFTELTLDVNAAELLHDSEDEIVLSPEVIDVIDERETVNIKGSVLAEKENEFNEYRALEDRDVKIKAYDGNESAASAVALDEDEADKEAGDFLLRGLEAGTYDLKAFVVDEEADEASVKDTSDYQAEGVEDIEIDPDREDDLLESIVLEVNDD